MTDAPPIDDEEPVATFPITHEEADTVLGWVEILKIAVPKMGYAPQERDLLERMAAWEDETDGS